MRSSVLLIFTLFTGLAGTACWANTPNASQDILAKLKSLQQKNKALRAEIEQKRVLEEKFHAQQKEIEALKAKLAGQDKSSLPSSDPNALSQKAENIWKADIALGAGLTRGNNDSHRVHAEFSAERKTDLDELDLSIEAELGENEGETTSEYIEGSAEYRREISDRVYWYALGQGRRDALADIDYRATLGPGVGYRFLETDTLSLLFEGGPVYVAEKLSHESLEHSLRARLFEEFIWQITSYAKFFQTAEFLANTQDFEDWIFEAEAGVETSITETLSLRLSAKNIHDNLPAEGRDKNDLSLNSAIVYRFF